MKNRVQKSLFITALMMLLASGAMAKKDNENGLKAMTFDGPYDEAIVNGAIHILAQQCDNGGWGYPHNVCTTSAYNITSPIVNGILTAYDVTGLSVFMNSAEAAGDFVVLGSTFTSNDSPKLYSQMPLNLWHLSARTGDNSYKIWVENGFYKALDLGTYGPTPAGDPAGSPGDMDTTAYINAYGFSSPWQNLKAWGFASHALAAERYCYQGIADQFEQGILDALANLDNSDPETDYYDVIGVVGGVWGLARVNRLDFPAIDAPSHSGVDEKTTLAGIADYLVSLQNTNGSFYHHSNLAAPITLDEETQTTAYAVLALIKAQERLPNKNYLPAIEQAKAWLATMQDIDGGFVSNPGSPDYYTDIEADAVHALGKEGVYDRIFQGQMECYVN